MNSSRANPTPSFGIDVREKALSGFPTFIMILVLGRSRFSRLTRCRSYFRIPSYTSPNSPVAHDTVASLISLRLSVPLLVPTMQGTPSSRLTIAAWQVLPPLFVTIAPAIFMIGSQSGSVMSVTSTSPA